MSVHFDKRLRWLACMLALALALALLLLPMLRGNHVAAQPGGFIGEWEITFEIVEGKAEAWWIGRVWQVDEDGVETLDGELRKDISAGCTIFGNPLIGRSFVQLDGIDDYIACTIPNIGALFAEIQPALANCRCRFDGPPYAAADVSPVLTTRPQTVIYHRQLHLEVLQREDVADLELLQSVSTFAPEVGAEVAFSLTLINHGPATATGVFVGDRLPSGYTYVASSGDGNYTPAFGRWEIGELAAGASATLQITATTNISGDYDNVAQVIRVNELDPDSAPANLPTHEDDDATGSMNPHFDKVRFPVVRTGEVEVSGDVVADAVAGLSRADSGVVASVAVSDTYGQVQLTLNFVTETQRIWQSNVFAVPQENGIQVWAGYNAARYVAINDEHGFADFLSAEGFWDAVRAGDFVEGFFMWESEAKQKYDPAPIPAHFNLGSGTQIYIGYNPDTDTYLEGILRAASVDPGCRGH